MSFLKNLLISSFLLSFGIIFLNDVHAYEHEVWQSGGLYYWKTFDVERGSSSDLAVAVEGAMGDTGNRDIHVTTSGTMNSTLNVRHPGVRLYCHNNTFTCNFSGAGIINNGHDGFEIHDLILRNATEYGIRSSGADNLRFTNVKAYDIGWIGMRIDSRTSNPWDYTIYNLYMKDCHFENCGSHGLETYSIDGIDIDGTITARNTGNCGVLFNQSRNGTVETVDAYNCCWGGGYAGLRYANACNNITTERLYADHCGRGFFIVQSGPTVNCHLNYAEIKECSDLGIWIENGTDCSVKGGCCESPIAVSGSGSYANVSTSCGSSSSDYYHMQSRHSGHCISIQDGSTSDNANIIQQACNSTYWRQQWMLNDLGNGYFQIKSRHSGKCMRASGDNVVQYTCFNDYWTEMFTREEASDGHFIYRNRHANKCLRLENSSTSSGASIVLDDCNTDWYSEQFERVTLKDAPEIELPSNIELFPSIVKNVLHINVQEELNSDAMVRIFNTNGAMIISKTLKNTNTLDLSGEPSGLYFVQLTHNNETESYKIIKR